MRAGEARVVAPGVASVAVAFGMARYGYGLLLPDMRAALHLRAGALGLIAAGSSVSYLAATAVAGAAAARVGARAMVLAAGLLGAVGMALVAASHGPALLAVGVLVAGAAAGLAFPPFSDVIAAELEPARRPRAFALVSSGTGAGVAVAAPVAILAGSSWRAAWLSFAAIAVLVGVVGALALPRTPRSARPAAPAAPLRASWFVCPRSGPLLVGALLVGLTASVWWTFAVELVAADGLSTTQSRVLQGLVGVASLLGALGGDLVRRLGARATYGVVAVLYVASLLALAGAPGSLPLALLAGVAFGASYNLLLAVEGLWSAEVFAERPSTGLAAVMAMSGLGLLAGPVVAGALADATSLRTAFVAAAALALGVLALRPRGVLGAA